MGPLNVVGGHLALDLVNTVEPRVPGGTGGNDHLGTPDDLLQWASRVALLDAEQAAELRRTWAGSDGGTRALAVASEVREATYAVLLAQLGTFAGADDALEVLLRHWRQAMGRSTLALTAG